jgi:hypothetical protein
MIRAESRVLNSPHEYSMRKALAHIETLASSRVDGASPQLCDLLRLEMMLQLHGQHEVSNVQIELLLHQDDQANSQDIIEAYRYMCTIDWIAQNIGSLSEISPQTILHLRKLCLQGAEPGESEEPVDFRKMEYPLPQNSIATTLYRPPDPTMVLPLIEDYCRFVNRDTFTPTAQAAFSHFHFEAIKPFADKLDRMGRIMSHVIYSRRETLESLALPLALMPAARTETHVRYILPYNLGLNVEDPKLFLIKERLIDYCASAALMAAQSVDVFLDMVHFLERQWRAHLGKVEHGSAVDRLLFILPGSPVITVTTAMHLIDKGFSTTNDAITRLSEAGILKLLKPYERNRVYGALEAIASFDEIEKRIIPRSPIVRDQTYNSFDTVIEGGLDCRQP